MDSAQSFYTTDEEFEGLVDRDPTANIVGYVETIVAPELAGKKKELLFKFVLTNGTKKIDILVWGSKLIDKYLQKVVSYKIISINAGLCKAAPQSDFRSSQGYVPFEIVVKEYTDVEFLGDHKINIGKKDNVKLVSFDDIHNFTGLILIQGHIRNKFALMHDITGKMSYGIGSICDEKTEKKLTVHINQFGPEDPKYELGEPVLITGEVNTEGAVLKVYCQNSKSVVLNNKEKPMAIEKVMHCNKTIISKRKRAE